jgi:two-component system, NtrC family, response regulator AtoC
VVMRTKKEDGRTILVGEDELEVQAYLDMALTCLGYSVELAQDGEEVLNYLSSSPSKVSAVLLDILMPGGNGLDTLKEIRRMDPNLPVIIVSGASSANNIIAAMKGGATDFLCKPVSHEDLEVALFSAFEQQASLPAPPPARSQCQVMPVATKAFSGSRNAKVREIYSLLPHIGWSEIPVLIQGETGSGKEVFARELHANSPRASRVFLKLNCAALPSELVESELFGYERGAFTGAFQRRAGMFEMANGGTILLDEIGDMDVRLQAKLLQVLQDHEFQRVGGKEVIKVDVRILAATHRNLENAIFEGTFREDLYYRLNVINIELPPLRERREDIVRLAEHLLHKHAPAGSPVPAITPRLNHAFMTYRWTGNIRELENVVRRLIVLGNPDFVASELLTKAGSRRLAPAGPEVPKTGSNDEVRAPILEQVTRAKKQAESEAIVAALESTRWNRKQAAALLQIEYKALLYKLKKLGLEDKPGPLNGGAGLHPADIRSMGNGF